VDIQLWNPKINKYKIQKFQEWMETQSIGQCEECDECEECNECEVKWLRFYTKSNNGNKEEAAIGLTYCSESAQIRTGLIKTTIHIEVGIDVVGLLAKFCTIEYEEDSESEEDEEDDPDYAL
jgi:hypothetical protein